MEDLLLSPIQQLGKALHRLTDLVFETQKKTEERSGYLTQDYFEKIVTFYYQRYILTMGSILFLTCPKAI